MSATTMPGSSGAMLGPDGATPIAGSITVSFGRLLVRIGNKVLEAVATSRMRKAARELQMLDDHMLRDLRITRTEIDRVVRYGREGEGSPIRTSIGLEAFIQK